MLTGSPSKEDLDRPVIGVTENLAAQHTVGHQIIFRGQTELNIVIILRPLRLYVYGVVQKHQSDSLNSWLQAILEVTLHSCIYHIKV